MRRRHENGEHCDLARGLTQAGAGFALWLYDSRFQSCIVGSFVRWLVGMVPALYFAAPIFLCQPFLKLNRYKNVRRGGDGEDQMRRRHDWR